MSPPQRQVNTLMVADVDPISKVFIRVEALFGLNRLPLVQELSWAKRAPMVIYNILLITTVITSVCVFPSHSKVQSPLDLIEYMFCMVFSYITRKRLGCYFDEINRFDIVVGCKPKTAEFLKRNILLHAIFLIVAVSVVFVVFVSQYMAVQMLMVRTSHVVELYFYGHLFSLINPRLGLISFQMESSLCNKDGNAKSAKRFCCYYNNTLRIKEIDGLMELYQIIINAHDFLINAIEWQFLMMLSISFMSTLYVTYEHALIFLGKDEVSTWRLGTFISLLVGNTFSLFAPCIYCDQLHAEVRRLRVLLASRLYENKMDKSKRSVARAMLSLTEERDLSLSLLGMLKIDISLPLKFMSLLLTYLIILLQFQKVINI